MIYALRERKFMRATHLAALLLIPGAASAGVYMETTHHDLLEPGKSSGKHKMWFDSGNFRAEDADARAIQIYKDKIVYIVEMDEKRYTTLDREGIERLSGQISEARKQMQARMANMPPEQRAMVEKMMGSMASSTAETPRVVKATARTESAAGQSCKVWEVTVDGKKEEELCVVAPSALPGGTEMMTTMRELGDLFKSFMQSLDKAGGNNAINDAWRDLQTVNGIPIITRMFDEGKATHEIRLTTVRSESVPASSFTVPAGFKQRTLDPRGGA
jgi:Domain of unknown function (DUF4412)